MNSPMVNTQTGVAVLVSTSLHALSARPCASRNDVKALAWGLKLAGNAVRAIHVGDARDLALRDYLAFGASVIEVLSGEPAPTLAHVLAPTPLILCGCRSEGMASGMLPYSLAAELGRPIVSDALEITLSDNKAHIVQFLPKGRRRIAVDLPAIVTVHPLTVIEARYVFARRLAGRIDSLPAHIESQQVSDDAWTDRDDRTPMKLKAADNRSGHARMIAATNVSSREGRVVIEGSSVAKAQIVLDYLREHGLLD